jgi:type I restriction enzyme S subunit
MDPMGLPPNWQTVKFGDVTTFTKKPKNLRYSEYNEIPFVPMSLVPIATLFAKEFIRKPSDKISSGTYFEPGDILLAKITPSFENGKQCIIEELPTPFGIATTEVIPIREVEGVSDKFYLFYYLLVPDVRALLAERMQGTTGRLRLATKTLADLEIPLPPLAEQRRIVAKLDTLSIQLDAAIDSLKAELARAEGLRQSILKHAFSGKLVPQNPNDKPASVLLKKIRDEK